MNNYDPNKKTPLYNQGGRFLFMFDPVSDKISAVYDSKYSHIYKAETSDFIMVFGLAVESLNKEAIRELKNRLKERNYLHVINNLLEIREKQ